MENMEEEKDVVISKKFAKKELKNATKGTKNVDMWVELLLKEKKAVVLTEKLEKTVKENIVVIGEDTVVVKNVILLQKDVDLLEQ